MKHLKPILGLLLALALLLGTVACTADKPKEQAEATDAPAQPTDAPEVEAYTPDPETIVPDSPTDAPEEKPTPEPSADVPDAPEVDITGEWYSNYYGVLQVFAFNADGTYTLTYPEIDDAVVTGAWVLDGDTVVLDEGAYYEPLKVQDGKLIWKDVISDAVPFTREKPEDVPVPDVPVVPTDNSAFYGVWKAEYITDTANTIRLSADSIGLNLVLRIDEVSVVMEVDEDPEQTLTLPYTVENGVLTFTIDADGVPTGTHLVLLADGTLQMTMDGEENADTIYILVPIK